MHKNIFKGKVLRKIYSIRKNTCTEKITQEEFVEYKILNEREEDKIYRIGEKVYINKLDVNITIEDVIKSTNNEYIYYTNYISIIEDEKVNYQNKKQIK